jgi:hypothetical protein
MPQEGEEGRRARDLVASDDTVAAERAPAATAQAFFSTMRGNPAAKLRSINMRHISLLIATLLFAVGAHAGTITLGPVGCSLVKQCIDIPNDAALKVDIYGAPGYPYFYIYLTDYADDGTPTTVSYKANLPSGSGYTNTLLTAADGRTIVASGGFGTYVTCVRSGRGQHCSTHWSFTGGSILW